MLGLELLGFGRRDRIPIVRGSSVVMELDLALWMRGLGSEE